jgi:hypothetical protein
MFNVYTRDGLERIQLPEHATVADLKKQINSNLSIPIEDITLSRNKDLVCPALKHLIGTIDAYQDWKELFSRNLTCRHFLYLLKATH